jgi:organic radical activating enzyme
MSDGMKLPVVEEFFSLQGEGYHVGKAAYFIRLGGCDISCNWCDSRHSCEHHNHPFIDVSDIVKKATAFDTDSVVVTGGEPLKWNLDYLCSELKKNDKKTYLETSGAYEMSGVWDWICLSPKKNMPPVNSAYELADELKVIIQDSSDFEWAEKNRQLVNSGCMLFLQPEWSKVKIIIPEIVEYVKCNPVWRVSLQAHKYMRIP